MCRPCVKMGFHRNVANFVLFFINNVMSYDVQSTRLFALSVSSIAVATDRLITSSKDVTCACVPTTPCQKQGRYTDVVISCQFIMMFC